MGRTRINPLAENEQRNIAPELHAKWLEQRKIGDIKLIAKKLGFSTVTINRAILHGNVATQELAENITKFFVERKKNELKMAESL